MKFIFLFAMPEEAAILDNFCTKLNWQKYKGFELCEFNYKQHICVAIISGIGLSLSAAAIGLAIEKYNPDAIINIGLAGGINCKIGDIIISQNAIFHDANVTAFDYDMHQLPNLPLQITSNIDLITKFKLKEFEVIENALTLSGNQFINNKEYVIKLKEQYPKAAAIEMEAASIAAICYKANCAFLLIKKISDLSDNNAATDFIAEVPNFSEKTQKILSKILNN